MIVNPSPKKHFFNQTRLHEANYLLLKTLLGDLETLSPQYSFSLMGDSHLEITLKEQHRYTSIIYFTLSLPHLKPFNNDLYLEARIYHDAHVVEVTHFQGHGRFSVQCKTPNMKGYHMDEKQQANRMLQESLRYALKSTKLLNSS